MKALKNPMAIGKIGAAIGLGSLVGGGFYYYKSTLPPNYNRVYTRIANLLDDNNQDDGSWGPIFLRLAWHSAGTFDKKSSTGGSNLASMRFAEAKHAANSGLNLAREKLVQIQKEERISFADLWSLAGVASIQVPLKLI